MKRAFLGIACAFGLAAAAPVAAMAEEGKIEGFGTDIPLSFAVKQIVPEGFQVSFGTGVDQSAKVSWKGGDDWHAVLERMASGSHLSVTYQGAKVVRITQAGGVSSVTAAAWSPSGDEKPRGGFMIVPYQAPKAEPAPAPAPAPAPEPAAAPEPAKAAPAAEAARKAAPVAEATRTEPVVEAAPIATVEVWRAPKGETADQVISGWAERAGWTTVFRTRVLYDVEASADFSGNFVEATSAFVKSIQAKPQLRATFYQGNNVVVLSNDADQVN